MRKTDVFKTCRKSKFLGKKIWRYALALKRKKVHLYSAKPLFWHYYLQLSFLHKMISQISFKLFCLRDIRILSELLRKWGWFQGHHERFPKYLSPKNYNFKKLRHDFVDERALITTILISFCHSRTLVIFTCERKYLKTHF